MKCQVLFSWKHMKFENVLVKSYAPSMIHSADSQLSQSCLDTKSLRRKKGRHHCEKDNQNFTKSLSSTALHKPNQGVRHTFYPHIRFILQNVCWKGAYLSK